MGGVGNLWILQALVRWISMRQRREHFCWIVNWTYIDRYDVWQSETGWNTIRPTCRTSLAKNYYRDIDSQLSNQLRTLTYICTAISLLQKHNIPFLMTCIDDLIFAPGPNEPSAIPLLQDHVRPYVVDFEGLNFLAWSRSKGFAISELGHPLEQAHAAAAQLMLPAIDAILHRA